jgi:hypothetical protein
MSQSLDDLTTEMIGLFGKRKVPALVIASNPQRDNDPTMSCKYTGNIMDMTCMMSTGVAVLARALEKQLNLSQDAALDMALDAIRDKIATAKFIKRR